MFIAAGCEGDGDHHQRWDSDPVDGDLIVWRRSLPHGKEWPDIPAMRDDLVDRGYAVKIVCVTRKFCDLVYSQRTRLKKRDEQTKSDIYRANEAVSNLVAQHDAALLWYRQLSDARFVRWFFGSIGLPEPVMSEEVENRNRSEQRV